MCTTTLTRFSRGYEPSPHCAHIRKINSISVSHPHPSSIAIGILHARCPLPQASRSPPPQDMDFKHTTESSSHVEKLSGPQNYRSWRITMRNYLIGGSFGIYPRHSRSPGKGIKARAEVFNRRFYQTNSIPIGSCSRDITLSLEWFMDPHATWKHLEQQYQPLGISQRFEAYTPYGLHELHEPSLQQQKYHSVLPTVPTR